MRNNPACLRPLIVSAVMAGLTIATAAPIQVADAASPSVLATSSSSMALQHPAQDKVAYLHDGSLLVGYFDGSKGVIDHVTNPSSAPVTSVAQTMAGDELTIYTLQGSGTTDVWVQAGAELVGSAPLEEIRHGTYDGASFKWDSATSIPGAISPGRQDPSVTWTGKWLIATWWDDTLGSNSDNVFMNWTSDRTGMTGWLGSAIQMTTTNQNSTQTSIRYSAKLGATIVVYGTHCRIFTRTLLDSAVDPSMGNWTGEASVDSGSDDCEGNFGGPQIAIDESSGDIHVFKAVTSSNSPSWSGITYWHGAMGGSGTISWSSRVIVDSTGATATDPPDIAGAIDSSGKVYVVWVTSVSSGAMKYATLSSPYTSASAAVTFPISGSQPRYPHIPAQAPLSHGYVPLVYQSGTSPYNIVLDTSTIGSPPPPPPDTTPPTVPTGVAAIATRTPEVDLSWSASTDNVGVTGYDIYRNGSSTPLATVGGPTLAYADKAVSDVTTYSYTVDAFDAAGNHSAKSSPAVSATTPDTAPPSVPTGVSATALTNAPQVNVSWNASTDNVGVTAYTLYRNGVALATVSGSTLNYADKPVAAATAYSYTVDAFDAAGNRSAKSAPASVVTPGYTSYTAVAPVRVLDTRNNGTTLGSGGSLDLAMAGASVPANATAVVINVTASNGSTGSFFTVYPTGVSRPTASNLNWSAHQTVPNLVTVGLGSGGSITIYNGVGTADAVVDLEGYYAPASGTSAGEYVPVVPARITDTRPGSGKPNSGLTLGSLGNLNVQVTGMGGIPATGVSAVILNVTATNTTAAGFFTAYPAGATLPVASNLNWTAGMTVPNRVIVPVGSGGMVSFHNGMGNADLIVDIGGYFTDSTSVGGSFSALVPSRIVDTRNGTSGFSSPVGQGQTIVVTVAGSGGVPAMASANPPSAVVLNVTVDGATAASDLTVWPDGGSAPVASDLNFSRGQTVANLVIVKLSPDGKIDLRNDFGSTNVIIDVVGWYG